MAFTREDILDEFASQAALGTRREWLEGVRVSRKRCRRGEQKRLSPEAYARWRESIAAWKRAHPERVRQHRCNRADKARLEKLRWRLANPAKQRESVRRSKLRARARARIVKAVLAALVLQAVGADGVARALAELREMAREQKRRWNRDHPGACARYSKKWRAKRKGAAP